MPQIAHFEKSLFLAEVTFKVVKTFVLTKHSSKSFSQVIT